jgi:tRNA threonylcarbamoyladenosine biosynthesis protein TsaB
VATILGIDTSTADTAVALSGGGEQIERRVGPGPDGRPRHSQALLGEIESALEEARGWDAVELIAVGVGPGSYTGLRIGIATARALAQTRGLPIVAVSSLAALARGIGEHAEASGRPRLAAIDARRDEVFAALENSDGEPLWEPFVAAPAAVAERLAALDSPPLAAGDGAVRFRHELKAGGATVPDNSDPVHRIAARHVSELGAAMAPSRPDEIEPVYLREPDAKVWLERDRR